MATRIEGARDSGTAGNIVAALVWKAQAAQKIFARSTQEQLDEAATAVGWAIMNPAHNKALAELAVKDTGLGVVADKIAKNHSKTLGLLRDLKGAISTGVIAEYPERGDRKSTRLNSSHGYISYAVFFF